MTLRRASSSFILVFALIAGSVAYTAFIVRRVTNEPATVADAASEVVNQPAIRNQMVDEITNSILGYLGPSLATTGDLDPATEARAIAEATVRTPEYEEAVRETLIEFHEMAFVGPRGKLFIDVAGVTDAVRATAVARNPIFGPMLPDDAELLVASPISEVPDFRSAKDRVNGVFWWSFTVAVAGMAAAFALHDKRGHVLRRIGFWAIVLAAGHILVAWVMPNLADGYVNEVDEVPIGETVTRVVASFVLKPAVFLLVGGLILVVLSIVWPAVTTSGRLAGRSAQRPETPDETPVYVPAPPNYPATPPAAYPPTAQGSLPPPPPPGARPVRAGPAAPTAAMPATEIPTSAMPSTAPQRGHRPGDEAFAPPDEEPPKGDSVFSD